MLTGDVALNYATDCYQDASNFVLVVNYRSLTTPKIIGDALVAIVFFRNIIPLLVLFALTPWIDAMGVQAVHILTAAVCFVVLLIPIPLIIWGKKARRSSAKRYRRMALRQPVHRTIGDY